MRRLVIADPPECRNTISVSVVMLGIDDDKVLYGRHEKTPNKYLAFVELELNRKVRLVNVDSVPYGIKLYGVTVWEEKDGFVAAPADTKSLLTETVDDILGSFASHYYDAAAASLSKD
jgi:hypothetical protein